MIPAFVLDFLSIHPFADSNGRMGRLLLALLLYQAGFLVGKYISLEKMVQDSAPQYYDVLLRCNAGWHEGRNDPAPFIDYTLGILLQAYREFEQRLDIAADAADACSLVRSVCAGMIGPFATRDLVEKIPTLRRASIEKSVRALCRQGILLRSGKGRGTTYVYRSRF